MRQSEPYYDLSVRELLLLIFVSGPPFVCMWGALRCAMTGHFFHPAGGGSAVQNNGDLTLFTLSALSLLVVLASLSTYGAEFFIRRKVCSWRMFAAQSVTGLYFFAFIAYNYEHLYRHLDFRSAGLHCALLLLGSLALGLFQASGAYLCSELIRGYFRKRYPMGGLKHPTRFPSA